ncbi:MAG: ATP-binding protein [Lachnospiraceae bacterium]|nr:ATP-binding protein [Lachnospiraceae bacterium]MBQ9233158.1 ATP-binding protein [Lachnospiraceae bacterium]
MLKRSIELKLKEWKENKSKKCLLVRGARQVGKTYLIEYFGKKEYKSCITINFLKNPSYKKIFEGDLDTKTLLLNISLYVTDSKLIPDETLIFLDEIQECPEAITSLKFWNEEKRYDVIASGSMLGIDYKRPSSYPVGAVEYIDMHPLSFYEFLIASNVSDEVIEKMRECFEKIEPVPPAINDKMMELLRLYIVLGGMPEVLNIFFEENDLQKADKKQRDILNDYKYDIAHYANADIKTKAEKCYFSLPEQLTKDNHKFKYSVVEKGGTTRKFGSSLDWLVGAYLVKQVYNLKGYNLPLKESRDEGNFRVYASDIGLYVSMFDYSIKERLFHPDAYSDFSKGNMYEALIADILIKNGHNELYFRKDETSTFEIEFFLETVDGVIPIEVKSGRSRSKSLDNVLKRNEIPYGYKLINGNVGKSDKKITLPLYMAMFL